jgi:aminoglycoside phosphotransferase (APT) family kinase protein
MKTTLFTLSAENAAEYGRAQRFIRGKATAEPLSGGVSCTVIRLHPDDGPPVVLKQALRRLKVTSTWESDPARIANEAAFLRLATGILGEATVPRVIGEDLGNHIVAMTSAPLDARNWKDQLLSGKTSTRLAAQCGEILRKLHSARFDPAQLPESMRTRRYFVELRIEPYFHASAEAEPDVATPLLSLASALMSDGDSLVHGDYTPKNFLVRGNTALYLLDYEVGHVGHGVFDVASILNHLYLKSRVAPQARSEFGAMSAGFLHSYNVGMPPRNTGPLLWECLGGLMLARVRGKSPVDYLPREEADGVARVAKGLLRGSISRLEELY